MAEVKYIRTYEISLSASETKTEAIKFVAPEGEQIRIDYFIVDATGKAEIKGWYDNDLRIDIYTTLTPASERGINPGILLEPGRTFSIDIIDLSGAANTVTIYLEYTKITP